FISKHSRLWGARNQFELNEFWVSLLEKAYAKLNGNYANLGGGLPVNALTDMSGGIEQRFEFKSTIQHSHLVKEDLFDFIKSCIDYGSLLACSINAASSTAEMILENGLVIGHTYSITHYYIIPTTKENDNTLAKRAILRFRNPWGNSIEWKGKWGDADPIWNSLDAVTRKRLSIRRRDDGEFWMAFEDFYKEFDVMEVCHISPDTYDEISLDTEDAEHHWRLWFSTGTWRAGENSGGSCATPGCRHHCYYWRNPQFVLELTSCRRNRNQLCQFIVALMQKPKGNDVSLITDEQYIQIRIFRIKPYVKIFDKKVYGPDDVERIESTGPYVNRREVSLLLKTMSGAYLIIPSMADVDVEQDFILRIFSEDTNVGRTYVNIFRDDDDEETKRNLLQQYAAIDAQISKKSSLSFQYIRTLFGSRENVDIQPNDPSKQCEDEQVDKKQTILKKNSK
ncbi:unnamed protein product, partial [Didymodactylos carnosus]